MTYANSADPDQTAPVRSGSTLIATPLNILGKPLHKNRSNFGEVDVAPAPSLPPHQSPHLPPADMGENMCRVSSFKKFGFKLYEKLQSQGTLCLYTSGVSK